LDNPSLLSVPFEELMSQEGVLPWLRRVADFLDIRATDVELALSLMPGTQKREYQDYCTPYNSDAEKMADLAASVPVVLAGKEAPTDLKPAEEDIERNLSKYVIAHNQFRTWQMAQAWTEIPIPISGRNWTVPDMEYFYGRSDVRGLMKKFGYPFDLSQEKDAPKEGAKKGKGGGEEAEAEKEAEVEAAQREADEEEGDDYEPDNNW
jgi:hypothetical protein